MKILKKCGVILVNILLWMIILLAALYAFTILTTRDDTNVSSVAGITPMIVKSNSMAPTFQSGDLIFIKKCDTSKLKEGDIITFHTIIDNEYALNTHRIKKIDGDDTLRSYTTQGDNNEVEDTHIIADGDIVGVYMGHISKLGKVMEFLSGSVGFMIVIVLPMLLFFIYQVYHLIMVSMKLKRASALEALEEAERLKQDQSSTEDAKKAKKEAEEILAEAKRMKEEAEALKAEAERGNVDE